MKVYVQEILSKESPDDGKCHQGLYQTLDADHWRIPRNLLWVEPLGIIPVVWLTFQ